MTRCNLSSINQQIILIKQINFSYWYLLLKNKKETVSTQMSGILYCSI